MTADNLARVPMAHRPWGLDVLTLGLCDFVGRSRSSTAYCRAHSIDWDSIEKAGAGLLRLASVVLEPGNRFHFGTGSEAIEAAVIEATDSEGDAQDLVAWPVADPSRVVTLIGNAAVLGQGWAENPASYFGGMPLQVYRTPLRWLKSGGRGVAVVDLKRTARLLVNMPGIDFAPEDRQHASELHDAMVSTSGVSRIVVPRARVAA